MFSFIILSFTICTRCILSFTIISTGHRNVRSNMVTRGPGDRITSYIAVACQGRLVSIWAGNIIQGQGAL